MSVVQARPIAPSTQERERMKQMVWGHNTEHRPRIGGPYGISYCSGSGFDGLAGEHDAAR